MGPRFAWRIGDLREAGAQRVGRLVGAHRDEGARHERLQSAMARSSCVRPA